MNSDNPWSKSKRIELGKYIIITVEGGEDSPRTWYMEVHMYTRHGELYRASYGSNLPFRWMAIIQAYVKYKIEADREIRKADAKSGKDAKK